MNLRTLFRKMSFSELSNLSLSNEGSGEIVEASVPRLIQCTNDGLKQLFTTFVLLERELLIQSLEWKSLYYLRKEHAFMDTTVGPLKYILDTPNNLFTGDLIKVLRVTNEVGATLPLNDPEQWASVFTPHYDSIQLTHPGDQQVFSVSYQASHPELNDVPAAGVDLLAQEVSVPPIFEKVLRTAITLAIFSSMSGQEYSVKSQQLAASYEAQCREIEDKNLIGNTAISSNVKLINRRFP